MSSKARKYLSYIAKFNNSPNKKELVKELSAEMKSRGVINGIRTMLHRRIHAKGGYAAKPAGFVIRKFRKNKVTLPEVTTPNVSIIIPMYDQLEYTLDCINSIWENSEFKDYEIIIADDNSNESSALIKTYFENIVVIRNTANLGFLKNCNNAATQARGEFLVFLNNDTQVQPGWLEEMLAVFNSFPGTGLVGSKLVYPNGRLQEAGGIIWQDGSGWNYGNQDDPNKPEYNYVKEADYISGASIMIPKKLWNELGGFDEIFAPAYYEDTDLCFRVRRHGLKVIYQPFSAVVHFEGVTHGKDVSKGIKHYQVVNQQKFMERWGDVLKLKSKNAENVFSEKDRTTGKKHVLVIDHYLPQVDKDAGSRCISNFMDCLMELGHNVKFLGENQNSSLHYQKLFQEKGVEVLYGPAVSFHDQSWKSYLKANMNNYDAILMSRSSVCTPIMTFLRSNNYRGNAIYFGHDLGYLRLEREAEEKGDEDMRKLAKKIKAAEDFMYQNADNSLVLSYDEIGYLKRYITKPLHYVPAFFFDTVNDIASYESREGLLFVGGFNHPPNRDAMLWFLEEIYGDLYEQGIKLTIVGSLMPDSIRRYKDKFSTLTILSDISVDELNALYSKVRIAIVPLRYGAGVKGKVIEAMSKGVPIVGTDIAFEGMPKDETYLYQGTNTPELFAAQILQVHNSKDKWLQLSRFGITYVQHHFNKENMKEVFRKVVG